MKILYTAFRESNTS